MIDKRMMYALGQRVAKTLDGSRPGYRGSDYSGGSSSSSGPAGGASAGGNYGGDSSGGTSANDMSNNRNEGPAGSRPGNSNTVDPGLQNALDAAAKRQDTITKSQSSNFGQFFGNRVPTYSPMSFGQKAGNAFGDVMGGIGGYIKGGGLLGMGLRGIGNLFGGPRTASTGNVGPGGIKTDGTYGTVQDAIDASLRNESPNDGDDGQGIMPMYNPNMLNVEGPVVEDEIGDGDTEFVNRFEISPEARQAQGVAALLEDQAIAEMISKLYT